MLLRKFLLLILALQVSTTALPQTSQDGSINIDLKNQPAQQAQQEMDPGLSLLLSIAGTSLGGFITFLGIVSSSGLLIAPYSDSTDKKIGYGTLGLAGLGITYIGAKMTWFYLKRGGKVLFHKEQPSKRS